MSAAAHRPDPRYRTCWLCGGEQPKTGSGGPRLTGYGLAAWRGDGGSEPPRAWPGYWLPLHRYVRAQPVFVGVACSELCREMARALLSACAQLMEE